MKFVKIFLSKFSRSPFVKIFPIRILYHTVFYYFINNLVTTLYNLRQPCYNLFHPCYSFIYTPATMYYNVVTWLSQCNNKVVNKIVTTWYQLVHSVLEIAVISPILISYYHWFKLLHNHNIIMIILYG